MKPRQAEVDLYYNGAAVKTVMDEYITDISYTDPASGAADSLDISIHDRARQWITAWMPISGDTLSAKISLSGDDAGGIPLVGTLHADKTAEQGRQNQLHCHSTGGQSLKEV